MRPCSTAADGAPRLLLKGTNFQVKVWSALLRVPQGRVVSYLELAREIGQPRAVRRSAGRSRPTLWAIVPCHRVIRATGALGDYRWGKARRARCWPGRQPVRTPPERRGFRSPATCPAADVTGGGLAASRRDCRHPL